MIIELRIDSSQLSSTNISDIIVYRIKYEGKNNAYNLYQERLKIKMVYYKQILLGAKEI